MHLPSWLVFCSRRLWLSSTFLFSNNGGRGGRYMQQTANFSCRSVKFWFAMVCKQNNICSLFWIVKMNDICEFILHSHTRNSSVIEERWRNISKHEKKFSASSHRREAASFSKLSVISLLTLSRQKMNGFNWCYCFLSVQLCLQLWKREHYFCLPGDFRGIGGKPK